MIQDLLISVSVDTNVFIHLYKSYTEDLLFDIFQHIYVHEYIIETELKKNALDVYEKVKEEIKKGRIILFTNKDIVDRGLIEIFNDNYQYYLTLFARDRGEAYAIALATALGIPSFVSDDIKNGGPHETLVKEYIEDVVPFAFYELLFLKYLKDDISLEDFEGEFNKIAKTMVIPMKFDSKVKITIGRFLSKNATNRDKEFLKSFVKINNINIRDRIDKLKEYIW